MRLDELSTQQRDLSESWEAQQAAVRTQASALRDAQTTNATLQLEVTRMLQNESMLAAQMAALRLSAASERASLESDIEALAVQRNTAEAEMLALRVAHKQEEARTRELGDALRVYREEELNGSIARKPLLLHHQQQQLAAPGPSVVHWQTQTEMQGEHLANLQAELLAASTREREAEARAVDLTRALTSAQMRIDELQSNFEFASASLSGSVSDHTSEVAQLQTSLADRELRVASLQARLAALEQSKQSSSHAHRDGTGPALVGDHSVPGQTLETQAGTASLSPAQRLGLSAGSHSAGGSSRTSLSANASPGSSAGSTPRSDAGSLQFLQDHYARLLETLSQDAAGQSDVVAQLSLNHSRLCAHFAAQTEAQDRALKAKQRELEACEVLLQAGTRDRWALLQRLENETQRVALLSSFLVDQTAEADALAGLSLVASSSS
jgi:hypothetical protein